MKRGEGEGEEREEERVEGGRGGDERERGEGAGGRRGETDRQMAKLRQTDSQQDRQAVGRKKM